MKITDLRCAVIGNHPVVRIVTDEGIDGFGQIEFWKPYARAHVLMLRDGVLGYDPTDVERVMQRIRTRGASKPWGSAVSAIEMALWDIAGKAAGVPVYKLLGGKVRDRVRVYNGAIRVPMTAWSAEDFAEDTRRQLAAPEGFTIIKQPIAFHSPMAREVDDFHYGEVTPPAPGLRDTGPLTKKGFDHVVDCVTAMKEVTGDGVGLALDCGPGWTLSDAQRFAKAMEPLHLMWLEDLLSGDQIPYVNARAYRDLTCSTVTPIHTGEQIYLRHNFRELVENGAVNILGPDPCDVGGIAELKRVAEYAEIHGIMIAPHGTANGLLGLAALVQVAAALPQNYIAFEYPAGETTWWYEIVEGLPERLVEDGLIEVPDRPGMGVTLNPEKTYPYLNEDDKSFFDK